MQKVGVNDLLYSKVPYDDDGWADAKQYLPSDFDMCLLNVKDKKFLMGWCSGTSWDGLRLEKTDEVLHWKKTKE